MSRPVPDLRLATGEDARRIAEIHVRARRAAYRDLIPAPQLAAENVESRRVRWMRRLSDPEGRCWLLIEGTDLLGFAYTARTADEGLGRDCAELFALYLVPEGTGRGLGRLLTGHALGDLESRGFAEVVLWFAEENLVAARFYETAGFEPDPRVPTVPFGDTGLSKRRLRRVLRESPSR